PDLMKLFSVEGIPLRIVDKLLPIYCKLNFSVLIHITLHALAQKKYSNQKVGQANPRLFTSNYFQRLTDSLLKIVAGMKFKTQTTWGNYYENDVDSSYLESKREIVTSLLHR